MHKLNFNVEFVSMYSSESKLSAFWHVNFAVYSHHNQTTDINAQLSE